MSTYKFRIRCNTSNKNIFVISPTTPTSCPDDPTHVIDQTKTTIVEKINKSEIKIKEEDGPTGGHFNCKTYRIMNAVANSISALNISFPYPISILNFNFISSQEHEGDVINISIAEDVMVAILKQPLSVGEKSITITDANKFVGMGVVVKDENNTESLGTLNHIIADDMIITEKPSTRNYTSGTPVMLPIYFMENFEIGRPGYYKIGEKKIGGAYMPAYTPIKLTYKNISSTNKSFLGYMEFLY